MSAVLERGTRGAPPSTPVSPLTLVEDLDPRTSGNALTWLVLATLLVVTYLPAFGWLHEKYSEVDSYYSHGYLVPLASAFLVWRQRRSLGALPVVPSAVGFWLLGGGLLLHILGRWWYVNFPMALSIPIVLTGLSLSLFGTAVTRRLAVPLGYLLFMIPLPKIAIIYLTFWLKLLAASLATQIVSEVGVPVLLQGAFIDLPTAHIEIDNACSGLRSLIALTAMGAVWAYLLPVSRLRKGIVLLTAVPIAMAANLARIITVITVAYLWGPTGHAFEWVDFRTGLLVFVLAALGLHGASLVVMAWERGVGRRSVPEASRRP